MILFVLILLLICACQQCKNVCKKPFEGFGVYLGQLKSFHGTNESIVDQVLQLVYHDLGIRLYRTEIMPQFSSKPNQFAIACINKQTCAWINVHRKLAKFNQIKVYASIWSPPHYMKIKYAGLLLLHSKWKRQYYEYIKRAAQSISDDFGIQFEKIAIVNEPDDLIAYWDHLSMLPMQLCKYLIEYNDTQLRICPETAWFWNMKLFMLFKSCQQVCQIIAVHGYFLHFWKQQVHYDTSFNRNQWNQPIWMTEISAPFVANGKPQMQDAIDLAISIINFVGFSCVSRYYYWLAFTRSPSGESLIWLNVKSNSLILPKKYFVYKQFARSTNQQTIYASLCSNHAYDCLQLGKNIFFVNNNQHPITTEYRVKLCCTYQLFDLSCDHQSTNLPAKSVCSTVFVDSKLKPLNGF